MNIPTIDLAQTGANIVNLRKATGLTVADIQMVFGFNSPQAIYVNVNEKVSRALMNF